MADDDWVKYQERLQQLSDLKVELNKTVKDHAKIATAYQKYLQANPYKKDKNYLKKRIQHIREEILRLIPDRT